MQLFKCIVTILQALEHKHLIMMFRTRLERDRLHATLAFKSQMLIMSAQLIALDISSQELLMLTNMLGENSKSQMMEAALGQLCLRFKRTQCKVGTVGIA